MSKSVHLRVSMRGRAPVVPGDSTVVGIESRASSNLSIQVAEGPDAGRRAILEAERALRVGTRKGLELVLGDAEVAPEHVVFELCGDGIAVRAMDPTRPVFTGALRILHAVVPVGVRIRVGQTQLIAEKEMAAADLAQQLWREGLVYTGEAMAPVAEAIARLAPHTTTVLVEGETGTGKEVVVRAIHRLGLRANGPFVVVDCGAIPAHLLESELFGHERGAFTGAAKRFAGAFERAHGGTLFLDEIGELPLAQQPALLGVLQRRRFRRVGGEREVDVDVRVIAATNRDLSDEVAAGRFRSDLYYRLATVRINVPPLRERSEDLPALIAHIAMDLTGSPHGLAVGPAELEYLSRQRFPGNVRELRTLLERLHTLGKLAASSKAPPFEERAEHLAAAGEVYPDSYRAARAQVLERFEREFLRDVITKCGGNASRAARLTGMDRPFLLKLLRRHGLR